jgi:ribose 5-phosphate isomerase B
MADKDDSARLVAIACDHGGFALKEALKAALPDVRWLDLGTDSAASVDYPDFAHKPVEPDAAF